jgi:hypothetical protein
VILSLSFSNSTSRASRPVVQYNVTSHTQSTYITSEERTPPHTPEAASRPRGKSGRRGWYERPRRRRKGRTLGGWLWLCVIACRFAVMAHSRPPPVSSTQSGWRRSVRLRHEETQAPDFKGRKGHRGVNVCIHVVC